MAVTGSGSLPRPTIVERPGRRDHDMTRHFLLGRGARVAKLAELDSEALVELVQSLDRAVEVDRIVMPARTKLGDDPLRFAERISADQYAAARIGVQAVKQPVDLAASVGVAEHWKSERGLGDEDIARHRHEARAGRVRAALVIAGNHHSLALVLEHDLRRSEDMAGGNEAHVNITDANASHHRPSAGPSAGHSGSPMIARVSGVASTAP